MALVDGLKSQLERAHKVARRHGAEPILILDLSSTCGRHRPCSTSRARPRPRSGCASACDGWEQRKAADTYANDLTKRARYMHYDPLYLARGLLIASGVIEGTCRHLINGRLHITGACWGFDGGEAVLKLRALLSSDDFDEYWTFHEAREFERNHAARTADGQPPELAQSGRGSHLKLVQ